MLLLLFCAFGTRAQQKKLPVKVSADSLQPAPAVIAPPVIDSAKLADSLRKKTNQKRYTPCGHSSWLGSNFKPPGLETAFCVCRNWYTCLSFFRQQKSVQIIAGSVHPEN